MQLSHYLSTHNITQFKFAAKLDICPATLWAWVKGKKFPRQKNINKIFQATKGAVTQQDWIDLHNK